MIFQLTVFDDSYKTLRLNRNERLYAGTEVEDQAMTWAMTFLQAAAPTNTISHDADAQSPSTPKEVLIVFTKLYLYVLIFS